jgi:hypothetical protein
MSELSSIQMSTSNKNQRGLLASAIFHICLLALFLFPFMSKFTAPVPVIEESGFMVLLGEPDAGLAGEEVGSENQEDVSPQPAPPAKPVESAAPILDTKSTSKVTQKPSTSTAKTSVISQPSSTANSNPTTAIDPNAEAIKKAAEQKSKFAKSIKQGKDGGNGNKPGQAGQANGDPNGSALTGITKGSGRVGGGLAGRSVEFEPSFTDNSQKTGKVALNVCVDPTGKVKSAEYTQKGSTTPDTYLIDLAKKTAMKYRFSKSEITSQCGSITIDFKVQ